jgi:hypothetical protein
MSWDTTQWRVFLTLVLSAVGASVVACSQSTAAIDASPTPTGDGLTVQYLDLVNSFWTDHVRARDNADVACLGTTPGGGTNGINASRCKNDAVAMLAAQDKLVAALASVTAPKQFSAEDQILRTQLPVANRDLETLITACDAGDLQAIQDAANTYIADMGPILDVLNKLNPSVEHV